MPVRPVGRMGKPQKNKFDLSDEEVRDAVNRLSDGEMMDMVLTILRTRCDTESMVKKFGVKNEA